MLRLARRLARRGLTELWLRGVLPLRVPKERPTMPVRIGVQLQPCHTGYADYRAAWLRADALGVDTLWTWDHFFPLYGEPNGAHFEGWTVLTALGAETKRARIGCLGGSIL